VRRWTRAASSPAANPIVRIVLAGGRNAVENGFLFRKRNKPLAAGTFPLRGLPDPPRRPDLLQVPKLLPRGRSFFNNGYAVLQLAGTSAKATYYAVGDTGSETAFYEETL